MSSSAPLVWPVLALWPRFSFGFGQNSVQPNANLGLQPNLTFLWAFSPPSLFALCISFRSFKRLFSIILNTPFFDHSQHPPLRDFLTRHPTDISSKKCKNLLSTVQNLLSISLPAVMDFFPAGEGRKSRYLNFFDSECRVQSARVLVAGDIILLRSSIFKLIIS